MGYCKDVETVIIYQMESDAAQYTAYLSFSLANCSRKPGNTSPQCVSQLDRKQLHTGSQFCNSWFINQTAEYIAVRLWFQPHFLGRAVLGI
jgi:hypothetical protein